MDHPQIIIPQMLDSQTQFPDTFDRTIVILGEDIQNQISIWERVVFQAILDLDVKNSYSSLDRDGKLQDFFQWYMARVNFDFPLLFLIYHLISTNIYLQRIILKKLQHRRDSN